MTLDPDTAQMIRRRMRERRVSFKQALNDAIRDGFVRPGTEQEFRTETASLGRSAIDLDRALQLAAELEDEELIAKMHGGS